MLGLMGSEAKKGVGSLKENKTGTKTPRSWDRMRPGCRGPEKDEWAAVLGEVGYLPGQVQSGI